MSFIESVKELISLQELPVPTFKATLVGDSALFLEGVLDVTEFTDKQITIRLKKGGFIIKGENLFLKKYCEGDLIVCGKIVSTEKL